MTNYGRKQTVFLLLLFLAAWPTSEPQAHALEQDAHPAAVGWGNLFVPGLGATLRDRPLTGLLEATLEIGTFYSGTLMAQETRFGIDGTLETPQNGRVGQAAAGEILQQFGLKYHFFNTFYHYQQAAMEAQDTDRERTNPQPLYRGTWKDILTAPFRADNLTSAWTWPVVLGIGSYLVYDYSRTSVNRRTAAFNGWDQGAYATNMIVSVPTGSSFGEDVFFHGFVQREMRGMTRSLLLAIASQALLFSALHENHYTSFTVATYFGIETECMKGELGPVMAAHFWINVIAGTLDYFAVRRSFGLSAPLNPPVALQFRIPF